MVGTYGIRQLPLQPRGFIATELGARVYTAACLNRANADAFSQTADVIPNLNIWINRPVMVNMTDHYGTVRTVTQNISWGSRGRMQTTMGLSYMRGWDGTIKQNEDGGYDKIYYTIGGIAGRPLNYYAMYNPGQLGTLSPTPSQTPANQNNGGK